MSGFFSLPNAEAGRSTVLSQLKGGGYRKLCEETNENKETK